MDRMRPPLAALALFLLAACQSAAPTAPVAPRHLKAPAAVGGDSTFAAMERGGTLAGSGN